MVSITANSSNSNVTATSNDDDAFHKDYKESRYLLPLLDVLRT